MKKKMKANGSKPSLSSLKSSLYDLISELPELTNSLTMEKELSTTGFLAIGATLNSIELHFQAINELLRQRKEAIPKGKISRCLNFATLSRIKMTESEIETRQGPIARLNEVYMNMGIRLRPELFSDTYRCLIQEEVNNTISPEAMVVPSPSPTEDIQLNSQQNEPEPLRREGEAYRSGFGKPEMKVTGDGEARP